MNQSPLALHRYFFTKIELLAHTNGDANNVNILTGTVSVGQHEAQKDHFLVTLEVVLSAETGKPTQYTGRFEVHGYFSVLEGYPKDQHEILVNTNGPAVLYSAIREMVLNLTSRGPWPQVLLRVVTFLKNGQEKEDKSVIGTYMPQMAVVTK
jgi:preprotein translocase subunit SecB